MIPEKLGKYEIRGTLGRGAMGQVYEGWDPLIHRQVAIKTVRLADASDEAAAEGLARFRREAQAAGRLSHPNIVGIYDFGETDEVAYITMEYVPGGSLKEVLDRREPLSPAWVCGIMVQMLAGLAYSHARSVVHRDIKPANVMLGADGTPKLADFGIARIETSNATSVGTIMGTPSYMAPEQFLGEEADSRSDIYAAGAMLFHLLTGTRPYEGNPSAIMQKVLNAPAPPRPSERLAGLPAALDPVLARAMARRKEDRFQDAGAFSAALRAALSGPARDAEEEMTVVMRPQPPPVSSPPVAAPPVAAPPVAAPPVAAPPVAARRNDPLLLAALGVLLLAAGSGAWLLSGPAGQPGRPAVAPPPAPVPRARPSPASQDSALNQAAAAIPCALVHADLLPGGVTLSGTVGEGAAETRLRLAASEAPGGIPAWQVRSVPASYCGALAAVHEAAASGLVAIELRMVRIAKVRGMIHLHPSLSGIAFPAHLRVDYLSADGTLFHVYPHAEQAGTPEVEDPGAILPANDTIQLGIGLHQVLAMVPPYDGDLILAVASDQELLPERRPNTEAAAPYLAALHEAIGQARAKGWRLAAGAASLAAMQP